MKKRNALRKDAKKIKLKKTNDKSINLDSESDSESSTEKKINKKNKKILSPKKNKNVKLLGNKIKGEKEIEENEIKNKRMKIEEENIYKPIKKEIKEEKEDDNIVVFPYEYTERLIDALTCYYCKGIYIRPYMINITGCEHIFCLGCITKMLENGESGICPKCKNHFTERNIKYGEVTDYYIKTFFPEIPVIIENNKKRLNQFMEQEAMKYNENRSQDEKGKNLKCEIIPFKESVSPKDKLPEINTSSNKFMITIKDGKENVVDIIKGQVIKKLNKRGILKEDDIEIRMQGIEISQFKTYEELKNLPMNLDETIPFYYSKKSDN